MNQGNQLLSAALRYADLGYRVFPCVPGDSKPITDHGFHDGTTDAEQIERWWAETPSANVGIATAGLIVIDFDPLDGKANSWLGDQPDRLLELAAAPTAITPRGGRHYVFRKPAGKNWRNTTSKLAPKIDTRTDGGYIVAPPSRRPDGTYRWIEGSELEDPLERLPEPPAWLVQWLDRLTVESVIAQSDGNPIPDGERNSTLARLAGSMRRVGMSQDEIEAALLRVNADRYVPPLPDREVARIAASIARYEPDQITVAIVENHWAQLFPEPAAETVEQADPGPTPEHLLHVPGFVNAVMDYTLEVSPYPERVLAFAGALAVQAVLAGRKVRDPSDNRTTLYLLALANSGAGKDQPRKVNQQILLAAGLPSLIGDRFASGEGIEDRLHISPMILFQTDEVDQIMTSINKGKDARHEGIMNVLLKMYTSANALYPMRVKAGQEPGVIDQPCLCVFGTAIPQHYYEALSMKMLTNGFFARQFILESRKRARGRDAVVKPLPDLIVATARWWAEFQPGEKNGNLQHWHPVPRVVELTPEAQEHLRLFRERADDEYSKAEDRADPVGMAIWARANEKARRLALVYACSKNHREPVIELDAAVWAAELVDHQTRRMLFMAAEHVSDNDFDARCKKLVATLRKWREKHGEAWMPFWQINRKLPWSERDHEEVRTSLLNQRVIAFTETATGGRPTRVYRLL